MKTPAYGLYGLREYMDLVACKTGLGEYEDVMKAKLGIEEHGGEDHERD